MPRKELSKAVAYFRTSSTTNVGPDKDSLKRQRSAVLTFAKSAGYEIAEEFYDAAVSGADAIDERPGFAAMLQRLLGNGVGQSLSRRRAASHATWSSKRRVGAFFATPA